MVGPGKQKWNVATFKAAFGDEYETVTDEEKVQLRAELQSICDSKLPSIRMLGKAALADVTATWAFIDDCVSSSRLAACSPMLTTSLPGRSP